jgi:hypothetical protein
MLAQRSPLEFIFKVLLGIVESCKFDFLQSQSISLEHEENFDLLKDQLAGGNFELSTLHKLVTFIATSIAKKSDKRNIL